jgi:DNA-binding response OmpR family regulator
MPDGSNGDATAGQRHDNPRQATAATMAHATAIGARPILVVEDHRIIADAMARVLRNDGYAPTVWHNGTEALDWVQSLNGAKGSIAAAILDIHLPDLHGLVLSSKLRELLGPTVPIIVVSGDTSMENLRSLPHVGATYFFPKPLNPAKLLERLRECLAPDAV